MYKWFISLRYIRRRLITFFSMAGVAIGVMVLVVVLSVMDGFKKEFIARLQGSLSHIVVSVKTADQEYVEIEKKIMQVPHVVACSPHLHGLVLIGTGRYYAGGMVIGIDFDKEQKVGKMDEYLITAYREQKLWAEELLENNIKRAYRELLAWKVLQVANTQAGDGKSNHTRLLCKQTHSFLSNFASKFFPQPLERYVAYTVDNNGKIVGLESHVPAPAAPLPDGNAAALEKWQKYMDGISRALENRNIFAYLDYFSQSLVYPNGINTVDPFDLTGVGDEDERPLLMGYELMRQLGLRRGDRIALMTGKRDSRAEAGKGDQLKAVSKQFKIAGAFKSGWQEIDARLVYARRSDLEGFLDVGSDVTEVCVALDDTRHADKVIDSLEQALNDTQYPQFVVERWEDRRRTLLAAIRLERNVMAFILSLIVLLAVVTIMIILILLVTEKTKDIGILKAMGASDRGIMTIFLANGFFISFFGAILGTGGGIWLSLKINWLSDWIYELTGFRVFPRDVYYLDKIPTEISLINIVTIVGVTLLLALLACTLPAFKAARMDAVEALNSDFPSLRWWRGKKPKNSVSYKGDPGFFGVENLIREYVMGEHTLRVLNGINLEIRKGEILVILGTSGAGKSTLLHILGLLDTPTSGHTYLQGGYIDHLSPRRQARVRSHELGFIFQFYHLLPEFTALENVLLGSMIRYRSWAWPLVKNEMIQRAQELLARVGLSERETHLPHQLSGGERQRVAIARALINNPQIVLCDEPTGNLDEDNAKVIKKLIWQLNKELNQTFVIVTHQEMISRDAHRVMALEHGKLQLISQKT